MADKKDKDKTVDELAREAMDAIKESERNQERNDEREAQETLKAKDEALKQEVRTKLRKKLRRLEREEEKKPKIDEVDTTFMIAWRNPDGRGTTYIGEYNEKNSFKINRGLYLFHLKITGEEIICEEWRRNSRTSVDLYTLKGKADKILKESNKANEILKEEKEKIKKKNL